MGVPKFIPEVVRAHFNAVFQATLPTGVANLEIDMNGIFHDATAEALVYGDARKQLERLRGAGAVAEADAKISAMTNPQLEERVFTAIAQQVMKLVDQVKPTKRLIMAVDGLAPLAKLNQQRGRRLKAAIDRATTVGLPPGLTRFSASAQFTPGTELMQRLNVYIRGFIQRNRNRLPPTVVYSSHLVPGEGEHKLLKYARESIPATETIVMIGADADLLMLGLQLPHPFYVIRKDLTADTYYDRVSNKRVPMNKVINVGMFRELIVNGGVGISEFVSAMFLYGNDFLPAQPGLSDIGASFPSLWGLLQQHKWVGADGSVDLNAWRDFLLAVVPLQQQLLATAGSTSYAYPFILAQSATTAEGFAYTDFSNSWYVRLFHADKVQYTDTEFATAITDTVNDYMTSLLWVWQYYSDHKAPSWNWAYPRLHTPLLPEMALVSDIRSLSPTNYPLNPIGQLIAVIPRFYRHILPDKVQAVYNANSPIFDMYPATVHTVLEGLQVGDEHRGTVMLPPIDLKRVIDVQARLPLTKHEWSFYVEEIAYVDILPETGVTLTGPSNMPVVRQNVPAVLPTTKNDFYGQQNLRLISEVYGYSVAREIFPLHNRFYPDIINVPKVVGITLIEPLKRVLAK